MLERSLIFFKYIKHKLFKRRPSLVIEFDRSKNPKVLLFLDKGDSIVQKIYFKNYAVEKQACTSSYSGNFALQMMSNVDVRRLSKLFSVVLSDLIYPSYFQFRIMGYHYTYKAFPRKNIMRLNLGYKFRFFMTLPSSVRVVIRKRFFSLVGSNKIALISLCKFIRHLRNLLPYKLKGFVFDDERPVLKQGKKVKYR
jgi:hypothetical protein